MKSKIYLAIYPMVKYFKIVYYTNMKDVTGKSHYII